MIPFAASGGERADAKHERVFQPKNEFFFLHRFDNKITVDAKSKKWVYKNNPSPGYSCCYSVSKDTPSFWRDAIFKTMNDRLKLGDCLVLSDAKDHLHFRCKRYFASGTGAKLEDQDEEFYSNDFASCEKMRDEFKRAGLQLQIEPTIAKQSPCK